MPLFQNLVDVFGDCTYMYMYAKLNHTKTIVFDCNALYIDMILCRHGYHNNYIGSWPCEGV